MSWENLKYGSIIYGTSSCALSKTNGKHRFAKSKNFEKPHFVIILTDSIFNKHQGTKTDYHLGVAISKSTHGKEDIRIESDSLTEEIKEHFGESIHPESYLVNSKPVIVQKSKILKYTNSTIQEIYGNYGVEFCNTLCESKQLLTEKLFDNMKNYTLPNLESLSNQCSCNDCGCLNPYEAKLMQGQITLSMCPNHLDSMAEFVAEPEMMKQNIACLNAMQLKLAKMDKGEFEDGENEYHKQLLKEDIEECKMYIESEGGYCYEVVLK